jgi:hypothetical protein
MFRVATVPFEHNRSEAVRIYCIAAKGYRSPKMMIDHAQLMQQPSGLCHGTMLRYKRGFFNLIFTSLTLKFKKDNKLVDPTVRDLLRHLMTLHHCDAEAMYYVDRWYIKKYGMVEAPIQKCRDMIKIKNHKF